MSLSKNIKKLVVEGEYTDVKENVVNTIKTAIEKATGLIIEDVIKDVDTLVDTSRGELPLEALDEESLQGILRRAYQESIVESLHSLDKGTTDMKIGRAFANNDDLLKCLVVLLSTKEKSDLF